MPNPAITLKLKRFRQRFGITAPRVAVRTQIGWQWYAVGLSALVFFVMVGTWWLLSYGESVQLKNELAELRSSTAENAVELIRLRAQSGTEQSVVRIERTTQQQLATRLKALEQENAALKADLALFEKLVPAAGVESVLRIERLSVVSGAEPGRYRFRLLLAFQSSKDVRAFRGSLQLTVTALQAGKEMVLQLPSAKDTAEYQVELRHLLRKEGNIILPPGAKIKHVEARILQGSVVKAKQLVNY